jgi:hypothetical protein
MCYRQFDTEVPKLMPAPQKRIALMPPDFSFRHHLARDD